MSLIVTSAEALSHWVVFGARAVCGLTILISLHYFAGRGRRNALTKTYTLPLEPLMSTFRERLAREEWQEILPLLSGAVGSQLANRCFLEILQDPRPGAVFFAAECLGEIKGSNIVGGTRRILRKRLLELVDSDLPSLYPVPHQGTELALLESTRARAVVELSRGWKDDPSVYDWLRTAALSHVAVIVRLTALNELARAWREKKDCFHIVCDRLAEDLDPLVRAAAARILATEWHDEPRTPEILLSHLFQEAQWRVQGTIVEILAEKYTGDSEVLTSFRIAAKQGSTVPIRQMAVRALARTWGQDNEVLKFVSSCARDDPDSYVRTLAVRELGKCAQTASKALQALQALASDCSHPDVRAQADQCLQKLPTMSGQVGGADR